MCTEFLSPYLFDKCLQLSHRYWINDLYLPYSFIVNIISEKLVCIIYNKNYVCTM